GRCNKNATLAAPNSLILLRWRTNPDPRPAVSLAVIEGRGHEPVERGGSGGMGLMQVEQSGIGHDHGSAASNPAIGQHLLLEGAIGFAFALDQPAGQVDRDRTACRVHQAMFGRSRVIELELDSPTSEDW